MFRIPEQMPPLPDEVILAAFRANGGWAQINGPEQIALAARGAEHVDAGQLTWDDFYAMGGLSLSQFVEVGRMLDGFHTRYKIGARVTPKLEVIEAKIIPKSRLVDLATAWRDGVRESDRVFERASHFPDKARIGSTDRELFYEQRRRALSMIWRVADSILGHPDMEAASQAYRDQLSLLYQDPFVSTRERNQFSAKTNNEVRQVVEGAVLDARHAIGDITNYTPHESAIGWWADTTFAYGTGPS